MSVIAMLVLIVRYRAVVGRPFADRKFTFKDFVIFPILLAGPWVAMAIFQVEMAFLHQAFALLVLAASRVRDALFDG